MQHPEEQPLAGGNVSAGVVRVGDTVRRPAGPWTPAVHADAYGLDEAERRRLVPLLGRRTRAMHDFLREQAALGTQPWSTLWAEGHGDVWRSDAAYIEQRADQWEKALLTG
ncbi:hypothetical protein [Streptomyces platensis]|uniref:hypothetical protein n=1 Tax=Streptomyces platensis TaxID=58346 RepID=UPI00386733C6|nr:hypothetical protein OG962_07835 [Streptomyces platensis]